MSADAMQTAREDLALLRVLLGDDEMGRIRSHDGGGNEDLAGLVALADDRQLRLAAVAADNLAPGEADQLRDTQRRAYRYSDQANAET